MRRDAIETDDSEGGATVRRSGRGRLLAALLLLIVLALAAVAAYRYLLTVDACETHDRQALFLRYPELESLWTRQQEETERLLARQRAQDIAINLDLGGERITPEEALRLSLNQINEISDLRREHKEIFRLTCRELARGK